MPLQGALCALKACRHLPIHGVRASNLTRRWQVPPLWVLWVERDAGWPLVTWLAICEACFFRAGTLEDPLAQASFRICHVAVQNFIANSHLVVAPVMCGHNDGNWNNTSSSPCCLRSCIVIQVGVAPRTITASSGFTIQAVSTRWPATPLLVSRLRHSQLAMGTGLCNKACNHKHRQCKRHSIFRFGWVLTRNGCKP